MEQRQLKFRMWNSEEGITYPIAVKNDISTRAANDDMVMQFTGLHDKNGKEIYEGDIVHASDIANWRVLWNENKTRWCYGNDVSNWALTKIRAKTIGVIGNIYENPELLAV